MIDTKLVLRMAIKNNRGKMRAENDLMPVSPFIENEGNCFIRTFNHHRLHRASTSLHLHNRDFSLQKPISPKSQVRQSCTEKSLGNITSWSNQPRIQPVKLKHHLTIKCFCTCISHKQCWQSTLCKWTYKVICNVRFLLQSWYLGIPEGQDFSADERHKQGYPVHSWLHIGGCRCLSLLLLFQLATARPPTLWSTASLLTDL